MLSSVQKDFPGLLPHTAIAVLKLLEGKTIDEELAAVGLQGRNDLYTSEFYKASVAATNKARFDALKTKSRGQKLKVFVVKRTHTMLILKSGFETMFKPYRFRVESVSNPCRIRVESVSNACRISVESVSNQCRISVGLMPHPCPIKGLCLSNHIRSCVESEYQVSRGVYCIFCRTCTQDDNRQVEEVDELLQQHLDDDMRRQFELVKVLVTVSYDDLIDCLCCDVNNFAVLLDPIPQGKELDTIPDKKNTKKHGYLSSTCVRDFFRKTCVAHVEIMSKPCRSHVSTKPKTFRNHRVKNFTPLRTKKRGYLSNTCFPECVRETCLTPVETISKPCRNQVEIMSEPCLGQLETMPKPCLTHVETFLKIHVGLHAAASDVVAVALR